MKTKIVIPEIVKPGQPERLERRRILSIRRQNERQQVLDLVKLAIDNPLIIGLAAMAGNEMLYRSGHYEAYKKKIYPTDSRGNRLPGPPVTTTEEVDQSALGGPVWFTIGNSLPLAQQRRNFINTFIIGVTTARAMSPLMSTIGGVKDIAGLAAVVK